MFFILYFSYKIIKRTKIWKPHEMDFVTVSFFVRVHISPSSHVCAQGIPTVEETEVPEEPPRTFGEKVFAILF